MGNEKMELTILKAVCLSLIAILAPIHSVMITVGFLIFADLFTGVLAAVKRNEKVSSSALRRTISKMVIYQIAVISGFVCEVYLMNGLLPVSKLIATAIGLVELTSILENANTITGKDIFREILKRLGSKNDSNTH
jgi:hypothetical protein